MVAKTFDPTRFDQSRIYDLPAPMPAWRWTGFISQPPKPTVTVDWNALVIESLTLPNGESIPSVSSFGGGRTTHFPDFPDPGTISVSFYENTASEANLALQRWRSMINNQAGYFGLPSHYKAKLSARLFGYESETNAVAQYEADGVWPSEAGSFDLNYNSSGRLIITATMVIDRMLMANRT